MSENSLPALFRALEVGESIVPRAHRLNGDHTNKEDIAQIEETLRRFITPIIARIRGRKFTAERMFQRTRSGDFIIATCVTRTE